MNATLTTDNYQEDMRTAMSNFTQISKLTSKMLLLNPTTRMVTVPKGQRLGLYKPEQSNIDYVKVKTLNLFR